jgi:hypothetical protein
LHDAEACAFLRNPHSYEAEQQRTRYLAALDAASLNQLFAGDPFFGLPAIEVGIRGARANGPARAPVTLLKAIAWVESNVTMASRSVPFESGGPALVSFDCGHGVMQVTTGMTVPLGTEGRPTANQTAVATHYVYNIARGAAILADKWNQAPDLRPVAGTDTGSDPALVENWYFATWSYNGFTGPGANSSNHPQDPAFGGWPRAAYACDGSQSRNRYPYQELAWGCMARPPAAGGQVLWAPLPASLPNTTLPQWFTPLSLANFRFPYASMDMLTPQPAHVDVTPQVAPGFAAQVLGQPSLGVSGSRVTVRLNGRPEDARATINVANGGTGILAWSAIGDQGWIVANPPAGVALGSDVPCRQDCGEIGAIEITVNPTLLPASSASGTLRIASPNGGAERTIRVQVEADFEVGAPGVSRVD